MLDCLLQDVLLTKGQCLSSSIVIQQTVRLLMLVSCRHANACISLVALSVACRIHQFEKVEQFFVTSCNNNASWEAFEEMLSNAEDFYTSLGLHYQVCTLLVPHTIYALQTLWLVLYVPIPCGICCAVLCRAVPCHAVPCH